MAPLPINVNGFPTHKTAGVADILATVGVGLMVSAAAEEDGVVILVPQIFVSTQ